ncbi:MAG: hypothetical protein IIV45_11345 [Lachnospiraceae bacterium]|nr:hypothetical protein [Lachnospiraceae bacterium]
MMADEKLFIVMLIINILVTILYLVCMFLIGKMKRSTWLKALVMLICPIVGPIFVIVSYLFYVIVFWNQVDLEDVIFSKERVQSKGIADEEVESNMIPLEEALAISNQEELRRLMMNVVKGKVSDSLATISLALEAEDTETSHYAASLLQERLNAFRMTVQRTSRLLQDTDEEEDKVRYAQKLLDYMGPIVEQQVFNNVEQKSYVQIMDMAGEIFYEKDILHMDARYYEMLCQRMIEIKDYAGAEKWCDRLKKEYPNALASYTSSLYLYFENGDKEKFFKTMEELKKSDIVLDKKTLELVRTFS